MVVIIWYLDLQLPVQSVHITTIVVSLHPDHCQVYLKQHYVIKFVSDLQQVGGLLRVLLFSPSIERPSQHYIIIQHIFILNHYILQTSDSISPTMTNAVNSNPMDEFRIDK